MRKLHFGGPILTMDHEPLSVPEKDLWNIYVLSNIKEERMLFQT